MRSIMRLQLEILSGRFRKERVASDTGATHKRLGRCHNGPLALLVVQCAAPFGQARLAKEYFLTTSNQRNDDTPVFNSFHDVKKKGGLRSVDLLLLEHL